MSEILKVAILHLFIRFFKSVSYRICLLEEKQCQNWSYLTNPTMC
jgi:hypothetical protein